jgi:nickel transport protein
MEVLRTKNDPQLDQIVLVPPQQSIDFVKSITPKQGAPANKPAAAPAPTPKK